MGPLLIGWRLLTAPLVLGGAVTIEVIAQIDEWWARRIAGEEPEH